MDTGNSNGPEGASKPWMRMTGAGLELAATFVLFGLVGWLFDYLLEMRQPSCMILLGLSGFVFAMYRFVRLALKVSEEQREIEQRSRERRRLDERSSAEAQLDDS